MISFYQDMRAIHRGDLLEYRKNMSFKSEAITLLAEAIFVGSSFASFYQIQYNSPSAEGGFFFIGAVFGASIHIAKLSVDSLLNDLRFVSKVAHVASRIVTLLGCLGISLLCTRIAAASLGLNQEVIYLAEPYLYAPIMGPLSVPSTVPQILSINRDVGGIIPLGMITYRIISNIFKQFREASQESRTFSPNIQIKAQ